MWVNFCISKKMCLWNMNMSIRTSFLYEVVCRHSLANIRKNRPNWQKNETVQIRYFTTPLKRGLSSVSNIPMSQYWFLMRYFSIFCVLSSPLLITNSSGALWYSCWARQKKRASQRRLWSIAQLKCLSSTAEYFFSLAKSVQSRRQK